MKTVLSVENMRKSDAYTIANKVPSKELMKRAGLGSFDKICKFASINKHKSNTNIEKDITFAILCGSGNNAGDGYVIAKELQKIGITVDLVLLKEKFSPDGMFYFDICNKSNIPYHFYSNKEQLDMYNYVVDCLLGTGFKGDVRGVAADAIRQINKSKAKVISIDINSGLNGDSGKTSLAVKSDLTISIGGYKTGHFIGDCKRYIKQLTNIDIGITPVEKPYLLVNKNEYDNLSKEKFDSYIVVRSLDELSKLVTKNT